MKQHPLNTPRTGLIGETKKTNLPIIFSGLLTDDYFCKIHLSCNSAITEEWIE
jgi:hypothetical protein